MFAKAIAALREWSGVLALFLVLSGGVAYAATGGNFILGTPNSANATTGLSSNVASGPTLDLTNTGGQPAASFTGGAGAAPFAVNSTRKVAKLNADRLDGIDSTGFVPSSGLQRIGPVTATPDPGGTATPLTATIGNLQFYGICDRGDAGGSDFEYMLIVTAANHSTYASLTQTAAGGTFGNGDMSPGTPYFLSQIQVPTGTPNFNPISGSAVEPNGNEVVFNLYQAMNARNQPGQCMFGGSFVVK
jgi:hypothetical protein